jgi:hypothetical protein
MGVYGVFTNHVVIYLNTVLVAMGSLTYPAISALVSTTSSPEQQVRRGRAGVGFAGSPSVLRSVVHKVSLVAKGVAQGMTTGIRSLCTGLGPAVFGLLFQVPVCFWLGVHPSCSCSCRPASRSPIAV